jgi:hypothetical protein
MYQARAWDGSRLPPRKGPDGRHHIEGELFIERRDGQHDIYLAVKPLLYMVEKRRSLLVTPMPRYWKVACCENKDHVTNLRDQAYQQHMLEDLYEAKRNFKDFLFHDGKRHFKVVDPSVDLKNMAEAEIWGSDPVHPLPGVYDKLAEAVVKIAGGMEEKADHKRRRTDSLDSGTRREEVPRGSNHSRGGPSTAPGRGRGIGSPMGWQRGAGGQGEAGRGRFVSGGRYRGRGAYN